jgi:hypothetical protein
MSEGQCVLDWLYNRKLLPIVNELGHPRVLQNFEKLVEWRTEKENNWYSPSNSKTKFKWDWIRFK